jgi:hypothetical protein
MCGSLITCLTGYAKRMLVAVTASDMRHIPILLVLPFLLPDLLLTEVQVYNRQNPREEPLVDSSFDVIEVTLLLSTWYRLFRRRNPLARDIRGAQTA